MLNIVINGLFSNFTLVAVVTSWFLAQVIKIGVYWIRDGELNFWHFFEAGGMPSAHSAAVTAVTLGVGLTLGWHTALFTACLVFALIVMYDATGVRRAAGKQALILNRIVEDIYSTGKVSHEKLKELMGHSPMEVVVGATLAAVATILVYYVYLIR